MYGQYIYTRTVSRYVSYVHGMNTELLDSEQVFVLGYMLTGLRSDDRLWIVSFPRQMISLFAAELIIQLWTGLLWLNKAGRHIFVCRRCLTRRIQRRMISWR
jgi:hypothetical protein